MANALIIFSALVVTAVFLQTCTALPIREKRSTLPSQRRCRQAGEELSPEEIKEDVDKIAAEVRNEERRVGHALQEEELQKLGEKMQRLPWYRRFGRWVAHHYKHFTATLSDLSAPIMAIAKVATLAVAAG